MNAREDANARTGALGRGLETLMGEQDAHTTPSSPQDDRRTAPPESAAAEKPDAQPAPTRDGGADGHADASGRALAGDVATVGGLIAGGALGAVAVAAFVLLGVKAVLSMQPRGLF